jgi:hypothetical protein|nr:MAG TPA: DEAD-like helicase [Caudoviricetes sp.]
MKGSYYLNDYMLKYRKKYEHGMINYNNSHAGSGKSSHVFAEDGLIFNTFNFVKEETIPKYDSVRVNKNYGKNLNKVIYITDNIMNKDSILTTYKDITKVLDKKFFKEAKEDDIIIDFENWVKTKGKIAVVTYAQFAKIMSKDYLRKFIYSYINLLVMDEFHNLFDYSDRFDDKEVNADRNYKNIIENLYELSKNCLLVCLSATPYYVEAGIDKMNDNIRMSYNKVLNSKDLEHIYQYEENEINKTMYPVSFIKKICFKGLDGKALIYTDKIETAKKYKKLLVKYGYNADYICTQRKMNEDQEAIKEYILNNDGALPEDLDILIINKAYDTGWNCKDEMVRTVIVDSYNPTIVTQARNRVRHDIDLFVFKVKREIEWIEEKYIVDEQGYSNEVHEIKSYYDTIRIWKCEKGILKLPYNIQPFKFTLNDKYIGFKLTSELKKEFINEYVEPYGRYSIDGETFNKFKNDLLFNGYIVKTFKGKNYGTYIFKKDQEIRKDLAVEIKKEVKKVNNEELYNYLDGLVGKRLYKEEQKQLAINADVRRNGKLLKGHEPINAGLKADNIPFVISIVETDWDRKLKDGSKNPMYGKVYWIVTEAE